MRFNNPKLITKISIIILIPFIILLIVNLTPSHRNIRQLNKICKSIESYNTSLKDAIDDKSINTEVTEELLTSNSIKLADINTELTKLNVISKNESIKQHIIETLSYNINLNNIILNIIRNPKNTNITLKYEEYCKNYELLLKGYENLKLIGLKAELPNSAKIFFENSSNLIGTIIKLNKEKNIELNQKKSYVSSLEECIDDFDVISEDIKPALDKIREDNRSLDVLLKDIKEKKSKFSDIKSKSYNLSIPEKGNNCYELLKDTLNYYDLYITSLEHSIIIEKSLDSKVDKNIDSSYLNSFSKYEDFIKSYNNLKDELYSFNKN